MDLKLCYNVPIVDSVDTWTSVTVFVLSRCQVGTKFLFETNLTYLNLT